MGIICSIWKCRDTVKQHWGEGAEYVLFRCERCGKETILCANEKVILKNDEKGRAAMKMMMEDREFSLACLIHSEFGTAKISYADYRKTERALDEIRERYGLDPGYVPPDPVKLLERGLWKPKQSNPKRENRKGKVSVEVRITGEGGNPEASGWTDVSEPSPAPQLSAGEQVERLKRRLKKHLDREEYEKAAKLRDQIGKLGGKI